MFLGDLTPLFGGGNEEYQRAYEATEQGRLEEVLANLKQCNEIDRAKARVVPVFDPLRENPEFQALAGSAINSHSYIAGYW